MTGPLIFMDPFPRNKAMVGTPECLDALAGLGRVIAHWGSPAPDDLVEKHLGEMEILIGQTAMPRTRIERAPKLRAIVNVKANWEPSLDYDACFRRGIHVLSAAPAMAPAVAEFCLCQAITLRRGLDSADRLFREGNESYGIAGNGAAHSLFGAKIALVGYGNLGRALVPLIRPFSPDITVFDPWLSEGYLKAQGLEPVCLERALSGADVIFFLAGVTSENEGFLTKQKLATIRKNACVILASRAEILDFEGLLALAAEGAFRAAIDVFPAEPVSLNSRYRDAPNIIFSAHLAGGIHDSYARIREMMLDDIGQILQDLPPLRLQRADRMTTAKMRSR